MTGPNVGGGKRTDYTRISTQKTMHVPSRFRLADSTMYAALPIVGTNQLILGSDRRDKSHMDRLRLPMANASVRWTAGDTEGFRKERCPYPKKNLCVVSIAFRPGARKKRN